MVLHIPADVERKLLEAMRNLKEPGLRRELSQYLIEGEIRGILRRRDQIVNIVAEEREEGRNRRPLRRLGPALADWLLSAPTASGAVKPVEKPGAGKLPVVLESRDGYTQHFGTLAFRQASEEAEFHQPGCPRVKSSEVRQGCVQVRQIQPGAG
jgi:hypothetical protein